MIVPVSQSRLLSGTAYAEDEFSGPASDSDSNQAVDFGPFVRALAADATVDNAIASGGGQQNSEILTNTIRAEGSMFANGEVWAFGAYADASGLNRMEVDFQLAAESSYTLQGEIAAFDSAVAEVSLRDGAGEIFGEIIFGTSTILPIHESGTLPPGAYTLYIQVEGSVAGFDFDSGYSSGQYDITFHVMPLTAAGPGGEVPDGDDVAQGLPLLLDRLDGGDVRLSWSASCRPDDDNFEVYEGEIGLQTSLAPVTCSTAGLFVWDVNPSFDSSFFLVVPTDGVTEGSYGDTSSGFERQPSALACRVQSLGAPVCP